MNKSQRIHLENGGNNNLNIKIRLEQDVDNIEFMTLKISTEDAYQNFNSDYGVLVGRVIANGGVGIPNAKISVFIPLTDEDSTNGDIVSIYPYETPRDKNNEGKRYNLLPRVSKKNSKTGLVSPKQAFGSFPIKEEVITNPTFLSVYKKYYKYTALTNKYGDYMIFGVPVGVQTVHLSVDITDIDGYSMTPQSMVKSLGYPENLFTDNNNKIKPSSDLNDLPNIETQDISVDIIPFWGDVENFEIGITRQDFRIRATINNFTYIFGSAFTDGSNAMWGDNFYIEAGVLKRRYIREVFRAKSDGDTTVGMFSKRTGLIKEKIYYYPANISDDDIDNGNVADDCSDMMILDPSEYSVHKRDGDFVFIVSCNRNKVINDEFGNLINVSPDSTSGIFTEFRGFITLELPTSSVSLGMSGDIGPETHVAPYRCRLKFPQHATTDENHQLSTNNMVKWRKENYRFKAGKYYSFSKFHGTVFCELASNDLTFPDDDLYFPTTNQNYLKHEQLNKTNVDPFWNVGIIVNDNASVDANFPSNSNTDNGTPCFGVNWINLSVYLPQLGAITDGAEFIKEVFTQDFFAPQYKENLEYNKQYVYDNNYPIASTDINIKWFPRSDLHWTDIIEVPKDDILKMYEYNKKGFTADDANINLQDKTYRNGTYIPSNTPYIWNTPTPYNMKIGDNTYFYKGFGDSNCIEFLISLGLI